MSPRASAGVMPWGMPIWVPTIPRDLGAGEASGAWVLARGRLPSRHPTKEREFSVCLRDNRSDAAETPGAGTRTGCARL